MSDATRGERSTLNRRQLLRLSTAAGLGAALPGAAGAAQRSRAAGAAATPGSCSTPRTAVAKTQYGKVRGYVEDGVLTFKGVPYGASTGGENRWLPAKPPAPWDGEYPALIYGANCPQRLHTWTPEQTFLYQWTDGWQSEDMLKVNIWTPSLTGSRPGDVLHPRRRLHLRLGLRAGVAGRRADGAAPRRRLGDRQPSPQHPRLPRPVRVRRAGLRRFGQRRHDRPGRGAPVGPRQHRQLRRRPRPRDDLRPVGRRLQGHDAARHAVGRGADPSRVGAVGRRRQSALGRTVARAHQAADRRARRQGHGRAAEDGLGPAERCRQRRGRGHEPAAGPGGRPDTAAGIGAARRLGTDRRRPHRHDARRSSRARPSISQERADADRLGERGRQPHVVPPDRGRVGRDAHEELRRRQGRGDRRAR